MSDTSFKEITYSLNKLIEDIEIGEIGLPDIQRPFVWSNAQVRDLFDSMYRGFPVGYLLFWANGLPGEYRQIGADGKQKAPRLLIVDGQQRLTSLFAVLKGIPVQPLHRAGSRPASPRERRAGLPSREAPARLLDPAGEGPGDRRALDRAA
ncbi:MAG: DUF262 domain-containing protein [Actinomycetota bacterium]